MENHHLHFMLKVSRFFPSYLASCQFRALPDVSENSITISKTQDIENDPSSPNPSYNFLKNPKKVQYEKSFLSPRKSSASCKRSPLSVSAAVSDIEGRKCLPATPISNITDSMNHVSKERRSQENTKRYISKSNVLQSSSSNSGWFSSSDEKYSREDSGETDNVFSLSSNSCDSFRLRSSRRFKRCEEMKSIDEMGRCSFSPSAVCVDTFLSSRKTVGENGKKKKTQMKSFPEKELGSDQISAQIYYNNEKSDPLASSRCRKTARNRRNTDNELSSGRRSSKFPVFGESYAVEKRSRDPYSDFRASMVEMIVEKRMFAAEDLERLLHCFLSLNAERYHGVILEVFSEICDTLFSN